MKKITSILITFFLFSVVNAQKTTSSPYSFYGLGENRFAGNTENALMGGISAYVDSTRVDVRNPASLGKLLLTSFSFGLTYTMNNLQTTASERQMKTTAIDYLSLSFPVYKNLGVSLGLSPHSSVGYHFSSTDATGFQGIYEGNGGVNRFYLATGYEILKGLRAGIGTQFYFGKTSFDNYFLQSGANYFINEKRDSRYRGVGWNFGVQYEQKVSNKLTASSSFLFSPKANLTAENELTLSTMNRLRTAILQTQQADLGANKKSEVSLPSHWTFGAGVGEQNKWFVGMDYQSTAMSDYQNSFLTSEYVTYKRGQRIGIGGYYIPYYNSYVSYWKRITYRAGFYYENTGIVLKNQEIDNFGITFGMGLPVGFSTLTLGAQIGKKGTKNLNLIQENYFGIKVGLTLNDRWFQKSKYN